MKTQQAIVSDSGWEAPINRYEIGQIYSVKGTWFNDGVIKVTKIDAPVRPDGKYIGTIYYEKVSGDMDWNKGSFQINSTVCHCSTLIK